MDLLDHYAVRSVSVSVCVYACGVCVWGCICVMDIERKGRGEREVKKQAKRSRESGWQ